ncbi:GspE/PulE family protein [Lentisphaerota bacterium WC36G]|nr:GspE/PulE family protein [Lentisphaerae bacterium WC36]
MLNNEEQALRDIILSEHICDEDQMTEVIEEQERTGKPLAEVLVNYEIISNDKILELIAENLGTEVIDLTQVELTPDVLGLVDPDQARTYGLIPLAFDGSTLTVTYKNPLDYQTADELSFSLGYDIFLMIASEEQIDAAIEKYYPESIESIADMLSDFNIDPTTLESDNASTEDIANAANETPIVKFVNVILSQAIKDKASDIHFEPFEKEFKIRYRIDGALYEMPPPPQNLAIPVISRIKILSGLNISERKMPQDGRIELKVRGKPIDLRVSTLPTAYGESVVLRILDRSVINLDLSVLGMPTDIVEKLKLMIEMPNGILLVTGPTGSGKTTTLYSCLKEVNKIGDKLLTAEDPVEYDIEGIIQVPVNHAVGMTFQKALKAFLRQDPDRIMIGEVRDLETAQMSIQASLTGHFVFSTLHTNDASSTVTRLVEMGVAPFLITSSLVGVLAQRLIRRVCPFCKEGYVPSDEDLESLELTREDVGERQFYFGRGCAECNNTGYKGRKAVVELLEISPSLVKLINSNAPTSVIKEKACQEGMVTIKENGIRSILDGESSLEEVTRYIL